MQSDLHTDPVVNTLDKWKRRVVALLLLLATIIISLTIVVLESGMLLRALAMIDQ
ncbi:MAG TPA: hypothetical protein VGG72_20250 [Bryobacteraceae bacterium]|jgi:hypothetical protein